MKRFALIFVFLFWFISINAQKQWELIEKSDDVDTCWSKFYNTPDNDKDGILFHGERSRAGNDTYFVFEKDLEYSVDMRTYATIDVYLVDASNNPASCEVDIYLIDWNNSAHHIGGLSAHTSYLGMWMADMYYNFQTNMSGVSAYRVRMVFRFFGLTSFSVVLDNFVTTNSLYEEGILVEGFDDIIATGITDIVIDAESEIPNEFKLSQNYPNPFNPKTKISFSIPETEFVSLKVYNIIGEEIETLINEEKFPGVYTINFDGTNLSSGTYLYRLQTGNFVQTKKMQLLK